MKTKTLWLEKAGSIYGAILLITLASAADAIVEIGSKLNNLGDIARMLSGGGVDATLFFDTWDMAGILAMLFMAAGYWMYFSGLSGFAKLQAEGDVRHVRNIRTGAILAFVALLIDYIPGFWIVSFICSVVSFFIMISGYSGLKHSLTFPDRARRGARLLFASMIWGVIGAIIGLIPILGSVIESVISVIVFFMVLLGWARIKNAVPLTFEGRRAVSVVRFGEVAGGTLMLWGIIITWLIMQMWALLYPSLINLLDNGDSLRMHCFLLGKFLYVLGSAFFILGLYVVLKSDFVGKRVIRVYAYTMMALVAMQIYVAVTNVLGVGVMTDNLFYALVIAAYIAFICTCILLNMVTDKRQVKIGVRYVLAVWCLNLLFSVAWWAWSYWAAMMDGDPITWNARSILRTFDLFMFICVPLMLMGWRRILSGIYGTEVVPAEMPKQDVPWTSQNDPIDEETLLRVSNKTDKELENILANKEDYNSKFISATELEQQKRAAKKASAALRAKAADKTTEELKNILANKEDYNSAYLAVMEEELKERVYSEKQLNNEERTVNSEKENPDRFMPRS